MSLGATATSYDAALSAMTAARENRELTTRAYQDDLVETEKVIRAQLSEAIMSAQYYKVRYDHFALESQINLVVGRETIERLGLSQ